LRNDPREFTCEVGTDDKPRVKGRGVDFGAPQMQAGQHLIVAVLKKRLERPGQRRNFAAGDIG
jgi:hypothetical protein